jgi:hypothetical protein
MVICHLRKSIVKDIKNWLLFSKIVPGGVSWPLGPTGKQSLARGKKKSWTTLFYPVIGVKYRHTHYSIIDTGRK